MTQTPRLRWGILGTGNIATVFAKGLAESQTGALVAVGSRSAAAAEAFGKTFGISQCHGSYEALLADPAVQAVYVSMPHPLHAEWAIRAAGAGKHVLCEKPLGMNHAEAMAIVEAARANDVFLMEAFMYRCHPLVARLVELLRERAIGDVRLITAAFCFNAPFDPASRLYDKALGGGGILDVGCYPVSMARLVAGVAAGGTIAEPLEVRAVGRLGATGVDEWSAAVLQFPGDVVAQVSAGVAVEAENVVRIFGSEGSIYLPKPWNPEADARIVVTRAGGAPPRDITVDAPGTLYALEADTVAAHLAGRQAVFPAMSWADTLGNMKALDRWRAAIGLEYEADKR